MAIGTVWDTGPWEPDAWADGTWAAASDTEPVVPVARASSLSLRVGIGLSILFAILLH